MSNTSSTTPVSPLPECSTVRLVDTADNARTYTVTGWKFVGCRGRWEVQATRPNQGISVPPEELELVPGVFQPCASVGAWVKHIPTGVLRRIRAIDPGGFFVTEDDSVWFWKHCEPALPPEPPLNWPVFWGGEWWVRDEDGYRPIEGGLTRLTWAELPGALIATTDEE